MKRLFFVISGIWISIIWGFINLVTNNNISMYCWIGFEIIVLIALIYCAFHKTVIGDENE
jgi:hypothetical protein